ncbi:MAG: cytochrome b/b6 domain-containing protein [Myxococcaceae bacterium]|nr:cytochrome b/b6 domain-containing protein [Myxococcaceae bacterium]MCI0672097.1 cytochrome b/b6 domain-containing protein [Myxococcaceae bacterium]
METPDTRSAQPWPIRLTHWANVVLLPIMAASGLQIWVAYPYMGPRGALMKPFPLQGWAPPEWARIGDWLAGARHWHFAFMWLFVLNGLVYVGYLFASGEWRRRLFLPRRDARGALAMAAYYLRLRREPPAPQFYNGLQRLGYTGALSLGALAVLTGAVMYKPVQLQALGWLVGGYEGARLLHSTSLFLLLVFTLGHVVLVAVHPRTVLAMVTGRGQT